MSQSFLPSENGLIHACLLRNSKQYITWNEVFQWTKQQGPLWLHLDRTHPHVEQWLHSEDSIIDPEIVNSLLKDDTRPRFSEINNEQVLLIVKGINLNSGDSLEEMVSLRIWTDGVRIITLGFKPLQSVQKLANQLKSGTGPETVDTLLLNLLQSIDSKIEPFVYELSNQLDTLEDTHSLESGIEIAGLSELQTQALKLKRHLVPQRDVLRRMRQTNNHYLKGLQSYWRELYYGMHIYVDELSEIAERILMLQEAKNQRLLQQSNQTMYLLSIIAAIFLPLSFLTGLLGINVGGIPGVDNSSAFLIVCIIVIIIGIVEYLFFKRKKWL
ncbi:CorA family divalent cation transporter [Aliikangiella sp. IMCC44359]|uniref:CorA family divalent cation transporter n=1 Tax=Aliikangiella sp. IMCC44359 TaxID=3459125 RepID=UPI00403B323D